MGAIVFLFLCAVAVVGCEPSKPCDRTAVMCIEAGPPEALRRFVVACVGGPPPADETDVRVRHCMRAGYALHCTRKVRVAVGAKYYTGIDENGAHYTHICAEVAD